MRSPAFAAFFLSGASSLIFQNIWGRMLHHVFGSTSVAISTVVTLFMAGLGLGAWLAGRWADRIRHPILTYACAEIGVGLWALAVPWLLNPEGWLAALNAWLRVEMGTGSLGFMLGRFAFVVPILLVPTTLMGASLPLLARHFVQAEQRAGTVGSRVGVLYAVNTIGAVTGVLLAGFVLMPTVGLATTNLVAVGLNLALGVGIFALRKPLLGDRWAPGQKLEILPSRAAAREETPAGEGSVPSRAAGAGPTGDPEEDADVAPAWPVSPFARKAAFVAFAASGAAALCYEVVWTRALAMTIGASVYSFALILSTFLVGIGLGSGLAAASMSSGRRVLVVTAIVAVGLTGLAASMWGVEEAVWAWLGVTGIASVPVGVVLVTALARDRRRLPGERQRPAAPAALMLLVPTMVALGQLVLFEGRLPVIIASVTVAVAVFAGLLVALRRYPVLQLAQIQLFIALATVANYLFQDDIPCGFARLVSSVDNLPEHVGTVQFFMFLTAGLCTLPATLGMGAMFPLTLRVWTEGGRGVARDVGTVYAGNTAGSIVGAWLPGFVLMPLLGLERTLHAGIVLNLLLALLMLVAGAAEPRVDPRRRAEAGPDPDLDAGGLAPASRMPLWHSATVYVQSPLIPALIALLYLGTAGPDGPLRWSLSQMTLGVFRVSLAADACDTESWGEPDIVYYKDGLSTTVSVERWGRHYALKNNGKVDASNGDDMPTQIMVAAYPLLFHPEGPEGLDVAVVGFGSGVTVGSALQFPIAQVDVVELEEATVGASWWFREVNHLDYPAAPGDAGWKFPYVDMDRLRVIHDDGRNYLASSPKKYDVIVSEPSNPWITGVSDLFTTDHFRITKRRLNAGGVYCQWVQLYELSPENIKTVYRTFASQFEHVLVFAAEDISSDTVLIGSDAPLTFDLERLRSVFELPRVAEEIERAYVHSPFDVLARVIFGSREEVLQYAQIEHRKRGGRWEAVPQSSNDPHGSCGRDCRQVPVPLNTDDNALIEFAAPRDLIGYERFEGYLATIYSPTWPYGHIGSEVRGLGEGDEAARNLAELALALVAHGRKAQAAELLARSEEVGEARETKVALEVLSRLLGDEGDPPIEVEPPVPGPHLAAGPARELSEGFEQVRRDVDRGAYAAALGAMEEIPTPVRDHSGPGMRLLYGYLLYQTAKTHPSRFAAAIEELEGLLRQDPDYVRRHPQLYYFLARAHDEELHYDKALRNMRRYVELAVVPETVEPAEPPPGEVPTTDAPGASDKSEHAGGPEDETTTVTSG